MDISILLKEVAKHEINKRHLERLKKCKTLADRTKSSKIRMQEYEDLAIEYQQLLQKK